MYPGTWNFVFSSNPCTRVHGMMGGWTGFLFSFFSGNFFQHVKKLLNFWNFVNIKVAKSKLDHFCFYCKLYFFVRKIRKIRNWNWVLIGGTPCISVINPPERKLAKRTSVQWVEINFERLNNNLCTRILMEIAKPNLANMYVVILEFWITPFPRFQMENFIGLIPEKPTENVLNWA